MINLLRFNGTHAALTLVIVLALAARLLVPAGFMPDTAAADGRVALVICTSDGPETIMVGPEHNPQQPRSGDHDARSDSSCAFAPVLAFGPALTAPPSALPPPTLPFAERTTAQPVAAAPPLHDYRAQAPPALLLA